MSKYTLQLNSDFTFHQSYGNDTICTDNILAETSFHMDDNLDSLTYDYVVTSTKGSWRVENDCLYLYSAVNEELARFEIEQVSKSKLVLIGRFGYKVIMRKK